MKLVFIILSSVLLITARVSYAELNVIHDYGGSSMGAYYEMLDPSDEESDLKMQSLAPESSKVDEGTYLPVHTTSLSAELFKSYPINFPTLKPFIVVGADELSKQWLIEREKYLNTIPGLVGVVVNVDSIDDFEQLKRLTTIPLYAVQGDALAETFKLTSYPALVTSNKVEQ